MKVEPDPILSQPKRIAWLMLLSKGAKRHNKTTQEILLWLSKDAPGLENRAAALSKALATVERWPRKGCETRRFIDVTLSDALKGVIGICPKAERSITNGRTRSAFSRIGRNGVNTRVCKFSKI